MRQFAIALSVACLTLVTHNCPAQAALPDPKDPTIKVASESLAGIKLGQSRHQVARRWGAPGSCYRGECLYQKGSRPNIIRTAGFAAVRYVDGKLIVASIRLGIKSDGSRISVNTPMTKFKTNTGLGLGDFPKDVKAAYPEAELSRNPNGYLLNGPNGDAMFFGADSGFHTIVDITVAPASAFAPPMVTVSR